MSPTTKKSPRTDARRSTLVLSLFVCGSSPLSCRAIENLQRVCHEQLAGRYELDVIDIRQQAQVARDAQIVAVPTLIKYGPPPFQRLVGDMSNVTQVLAGLGVGLSGHK